VLERLLSGFIVAADQTKPLIAVILTALQEFTTLPPGSFRIDHIEPIGEVVNVQTQAHIAAISAAIHEFTSMPMGSFRIVGIKPVGTIINTWKMAGRLELMGLEIDHLR
jgi:hypothetical protein